MTRLLEHTMTELAESLALGASESTLVSALGGRVVHVDRLEANFPAEARLGRDPTGDLPVAVHADLPPGGWRGALEPALGRLSFTLAGELSPEQAATTEAVTKEMASTAEVAS